MIITNKTDRMIEIINTKTGTVTKMKPGRGDYRISYKDSGVKDQLVSLLESGDIFFVVPVLKDKKR